MSEKKKETKYKRSFGFILTLIALVLSIAVTFVYKNAYDGSEYFAPLATQVIYVGAVLCVLLSLLKATANYAPIPLFVADFAAFLLFINAVYIYFADIFYGGITAEAIASMDAKMIACIALFVLSFLTANVAMYVKQCKKVSKKR